MRKFKGGRRRGGRGWHQHPHQQQQQQGCHWQQGEQEEYWEEQGSWHQQQEQGPWQQEQRRRQQSKRRNLARDQRATLLRLMTEPSFQQTKLGAAFSPARQLHSQLFLHLAARYIGAPLGKVILGGARLRPEAERIWRERQEEQQQQSQLWRRQQREERRRQRQQQAPAPSPAAVAAAPDIAPPPYPAEDQQLAASEAGLPVVAAATRQGAQQRRKRGASAVAVPADAAMPAAAQQQPAQMPPGSTQPASSKKRKVQEEKEGAAAAKGGKKKLRMPQQKQQGGAAAGPAVAAAAEAAAAVAPASDELLAKKIKKKKKKKKAVDLETAAPPVRPGSPEQQQLQSEAAGAEESPPAKKRKKKEARQQHEQQEVIAAAPSAPAGVAAAAMPPAALLAAAAEQQQPAAAQPAAAAAPAPAAALAPVAKPAAARKRWREEDEAELQRLATEPAYRQQVLHSEELNWAAIGAHLNRSGTAAEARWAQLRSKGGCGSGSPDSRRAAQAVSGTGNKRRQTIQQPQQPTGGGQAAAGVAHPATAFERQQGAHRSSGMPPGADVGSGGSNSIGGAAVRVAINLAPPPPQQTGPGRGHDCGMQYDEVGSRINPWTQEQEIELLMLGSNPSYRLQQLGSSKLSWKAIGRHLGHTQHGTKFAFRRLTSPPKHVGKPSAAAPKRWQAEEEDELQRLAEDEQYRLQCLGNSKLDWSAIGQVFGVVGTAARTKHWGLSTKKAAGPPAARAPPRPELFNNMVETVLHRMPSQTATAGQICRAVAENPALSAKLLPTDWLPLSSRKKSPRFVMSIRHALQRHPRIQQTGAKTCKEVLWQLMDAEEGGADMEQQPPKKRPLGTSAPLLGKHSRSPN